MNDPVIESIKQQRREEDATLARERFNTFHHDIAPYRKKAVELLKQFSPIAQEAQKLASEAATIQNPPDRVAGLVQDILNLCHSIPMRIRAALDEIDTTGPHDLAFDPEHEAKYREGEAKFNRLVAALNPGDVARLLSANTVKLRYELKTLAESSGADSTVTIPAAPVSSAPRAVIVKADHRTLRH